MGSLALHQYVELAYAAELLLTGATREREVIALIAEDRTNASISFTLFLSAGTVEKNVPAVFIKPRLPRGQMISVVCWPGSTPAAFACGATTATHRA